nr:hypothetical protein [Tanacetum cinerariifolium]
NGNDVGTCGGKCSDDGGGGSGGEGICGSRDDSGVSGDGGRMGDGTGVSAASSVSNSYVSSAEGIRAWRETLILGEIPTITSHSDCPNSQKKMDHQYPTVAKIPVLDTGKFEQWQFRIQQYLQDKHYALWEVIKFGDSYKVPTNSDPADSSTNDRRTVTVTTDDMQKKKNDLKARTTLLLSLPDEHQLRLQLIVSQLQLMDVDIEKDDLNKKFLTSLAPEWLMHTIVWRNRNDLESMSLDDLYNHLKVYEAEVQKKPNLNSQDMAFISSSKNNNNEDGNTVYVTTATTAFPTSSVNVAIISQDTASTFIASQSNDSQIKFEDINQIDEDDMEEMDIK